jgi:hypothetical protein
MALYSAEFPFLIPALAVPWHMLPNVGFDVQFGQKLPVLPFWEIGKPAKTDAIKEPEAFQSSERKQWKRFLEFY